jgi:hypothetical protein
MQQFAAIILKVRVLSQYEPSIWDKFSVRY